MLDQVGSFTLEIQPAAATILYSLLGGWIYAFHVFFSSMCLHGNIQKGRKQSILSKMVLDFQSVYIKKNVYMYNITYIICNDIISFYIILYYIKLYYSILYIKYIGTTPFQPQDARNEKVSQVFFGTPISPMLFFFILTG